MKGKTHTNRWRMMWIIISLATRLVIPTLYQLLWTNLDLVFWMSLHVLSRVLVPLPHVVEHVPQDPHELQPKHTLLSRVLALLPHVIVHVPQDLHMLQPKHTLLSCVLALLPHLLEHVSQNPQELLPKYIYNLSDGTTQWPDPTTAALTIFFWKF